MADRALEELWDDTVARGAPFDARSVAHLPAPAQRYLRHAIAEGTPLAHAVRLVMHGEIKLGGAWSPFDAEQVIHAARGFVWRARVRMKGLPVRGSDRWVDGAGALDWRLLGVIPVARASGADVSRSAAGRAQAETIWLPSILTGVEWRARDDAHADVKVSIHGESGHVELGVDERGALREIVFDRWGDPEQKGTSSTFPFGGVIEDERTFEGFTIPSRVRVGWFFGTSRWDEGEFFRATIDHATYR
ncbi:DUF6544 family protein [Sandaracinus amylolyticus]|uniref:DUF6544 family protein n=1 Tax=Sandaracinus amylolyticus TaxID=927083 RepID=UPI001F2A1C31|nr:DUF6544 family protein [Sandaracinus amylolyticus]UJR84858.1 Hypothetical protein I5071_69370 [Sandaracinus amylolyticus]